MIKSSERFCQYLDILQATTSYAETSRALQQSEDLIFKWLRASKKAKEAGESPSVFLFAYGEDDEVLYLHEHVKAAITTSIEEIESAARGRARHGVWTVSKFQGKTVYQSNPDYEDPEMRELLGITDPWLRDKNGDRIPEMNWAPPSTDLVMGILAAHSKRYKKQSQVNVDVNARHSGGVLLVGGSAPKTITQQTPLPLPALEIIDEPERPLTDDEPNRIEEPGEDQQEQYEPEPIASPPAPAPAPIVCGDSELIRDLLTRAARKPTDPLRAAPVMAFHPDDTDPRRCGPGTVPAGGVKVS